jgi:hypothetical protein
MIGMIIGNILYRIYLTGVYVKEALDNKYYIVEIVE